jgi:lysophospholipase L1-like esterase
MIMKTVLCFGDSNTYGTPPMTGPDDARRFDDETRWPAAMRPLLGQDWTVIEEGLPGRTTVLDDPIEGAHKNARRYLLACLETHRPLDAVVLKLGTNNLKARFHQRASDIAASIGVLAEIIGSIKNLGLPAPKLLIVCPPPILIAGWLSDMFTGGDETSARLAPAYRAIAQQLGAAFFDAGTVISSSPLDGIHFDDVEHRKLAVAIAAELRRLF